MARITTIDLEYALEVQDLSSIRPNGVNIYFRELTGAEFNGAKEIFRLQYRGAKYLNGIEVVIKNHSGVLDYIALDLIGLSSYMDPATMVQTPARNVLFTYNNDKVDTFCEFIINTGLKEAILNGVIDDETIERITKY